MSRHYAKALLALLLAALLAGCPLAGGKSNTRTTSSSSPAASSTTSTTPVAAPDPVEASFRQAVQFMQSRDYAKAEPLLSKLTQEQPQLSGPWLNLGILYARTQRRNPAIQALRKGLALSPGNATAQNQLGILLREAGEHKAAEQAYQAALAANANYANAHLNLGVLYDVYLKQPALALKHYEQYQRLAPADGARVAVWIADLKQRMQGKS